MNFPKTLFVKIEKDGSTEYFCADKDAALLVEMGQETIIAKYQLVEKGTAIGVAQFVPPKRGR